MGSTDSTVTEIGFADLALYFNVSRQAVSKWYQNYGPHSNADPNDRMPETTRVLKPQHGYGVSPRWDKSQLLDIAAWRERVLQAPRNK